MPPTYAGPSRASAEVLIWQGRLRVLIASTAAVAEFLLLASYGGDRALLATVLVSTIAYIVLAVITGAVARRSGTIPEWLVITAVCADVLLIFGMTIAFSAPQYYSRVLIFAFLALHLTTFYLGQRAAAAGFAFTLALYPLLVRASIARGAELQWREEVWSMAAFLLAAVVLLVEQGSLRRRLNRIAGLFGRAEEGDFTDLYDDNADRYPDAITIVGRAYNRVRGHLANLVLTDSLTGCVNRRGFDQVLAHEVARSGRAESEFALLAMDIDHFKQVNDTLGHLAGDAVLREVGALLHHVARSGDTVARTGGEEFCLVLPDTPPQGAYQLAMRLCDAMRRHKFVGAPGIRLTVSIGVVSQSAGGVLRQTVEVLKGRADSALYGAKRGGRDRVCVWSDDEGVRPSPPGAVSVSSGPSSSAG